MCRIILSGAMTIAELTHHASAIDLAHIVCRLSV